MTHMERKHRNLTIQQMADVLNGKILLTTDCEKRQTLSEIADTLVELDEQNGLLRERNYQLEERIAIMTEGRR